MIELSITNHNQAGWAWQMTTEPYETRLERSLVKLREKDSFITGIHELQLSGGKYIPTIRKFFPESDYVLILPKAYNNQPKSVVSLLLIKKEFCESYSIATLEGLEDSLRYNFVTVNTPIEGLCFRFLNANVPHQCFDENKTAEWYRKSRVELRKLFQNNIRELAMTYRSEPDLKFFMMVDMNTSPDDPFMKELAYSYDSPMLDAVKEEDRYIPTWNNNGSNNRIDYILYSKGMISERSGASVRFTEVDDSSITENTSDHCILVGGITIADV